MRKHHKTRAGSRWLAIWAGIGFLTSISASASDIIAAKVYRVIDGDTVHLLPLQPQVSAGSPVIKVRMLGIDTPESHYILNGKKYSQDPWGTLAGDYLASILPVGAQVSLVSYGLDKYGRTLGRVVYQGRDLNLAMVESGWAIPYAICSENHCTRASLNEQSVSTYAAACDRARAKGQGIFNPTNKLNELPYVFRRRVGNTQMEKYVGDVRGSSYVKPTEYEQVDACFRLFFMTEADAAMLGFHRE